MYLDGRDIPGFGHVFLYRDQMDKTSWFLYFLYRIADENRVKSAHKVKLTDKQLLQWMVPILLVMLIYLGTWTLSAPPYAEEIADNYGLKFNQCSFNWWDHSLAIGTEKKKNQIGKNTLKDVNGIYI